MLGTPSGPAASGRKILITGGPTIEDLDPVRFLGNRSTGRMGLALAGAALRAGCRARLILGPAPLEPPPGIETVRVRSAADMLAAVLGHFAWADALIMAAAVADYTPSDPSREKLKKGPGDLLLRLKRTEDILSRVGALPERRGKCLVGFSLDVGVNLDEGRRKLREKGLDLVVVNSVASFAAGQTSAWLVSAAGECDCGGLSKDDLAASVVARVLDFLSRPVPRRTPPCQA
ncbi:MAG: hypothetical protein LBU23_00465 [Planctomycetota bacterium]|jgi:phosphopantothenoylcysteine decarboxylase/phosphopantothenate--cysteine ligase|nr:hypothetical protein [Planctomycetota bacterium]